MKLPRDLSGAEIVEGLSRFWGYTKIHQAGSHIILETNHPRQQRISIPNHKPLRIGTLNSILRSVAKHKGVEREDILRDLT